MPDPDRNVPPADYDEALASPMSRDELVEMYAAYGVTEPDLDAMPRANAEAEIFDGDNDDYWRSIVDGILAKTGMRAARTESDRNSIPTI